MTSEKSALNTICTTPTPAKGTKRISEVPVCNTQDSLAGPSQVHGSASSTREERLAKVLSPGSNGEDVPSPFKKRLFWPGTPSKLKRTKRAKVKLPAVLTSKEWQEYEESKREKKKQEELKKAERKRMREEKREKNKKNPKAKVPKKKVVNDDDEDWICQVCNKRYSAELILKVRRRWIECDKCKNTFHYKCIPKKHLDAFGIEESDEDEDELVFYCHNCANDIDSDIEPLVLSESDDDL